MSSSSSSQSASQSVGRYRRRQRLGEGTYGVVYEGIDTQSGRQVALKKIRLEAEDEGVPSTTIREISVLKELQHPNVVNLIEVVYHQDELYLVFEFVDRDLRQYVKANGNPSPQASKSIVYDILQGLNFCHSRRIIHRDLKPQNLLIGADGHIKIADFGLARTVSVPVRSYTHEVVTLYYRSIEIFLGKPDYGYPIDMWSVGCIFAELFLGRPLFQGDCEIDMIFKVFQVLGTPTEDVWPGVTSLPCWSNSFMRITGNHLSEAVPQMNAEEISLLQEMIQYDPGHRISAKRALLHPYFDDLNGVNVRHQQQASL